MFEQIGLFTGFLLEFHVFIADSAQAEYCSTFHCSFVRSFVCHKMELTAAAMYDDVICRRSSWEASEGSSGVIGGH